MEKRPKKLPLITPEERAAFLMEFGERASRLGRRLLKLGRDNQTTSDPWIDALEDLDMRGDRTTLVDLLRSRYPLDDEAREFLADLIERGVARPAKRPRVPAYTVSEKQEERLLKKKTIRRTNPNNRRP